MLGLVIAVGADIDRPQNVGWQWRGLTHKKAASQKISLSYHWLFLGLSPKTVACNNPIQPNYSLFNI